MKTISKFQKAIFLCILLLGLGASTKYAAQCPHRIINNTNCNIIVTITQYDTPLACTNQCWQITGFTVGAYTTHTIPCDACNACRIRIDVEYVGTASSTASLDSNGTTIGITAGGGCTANTLDYNGTDFSFN